MSGIKINNLIKKYGEFEAISSMNFEIPDGSFCVFLGPSGCGKSTTLNCVAGLEEVSSGSIFINDVDVTNLAPHKRDIAMVFQSSLLYPHLTARENIMMSLRKTDTSPTEIKDRFAHAVSILDIASILDKKPSKMSGGQRQRVAMAKAIVRKPAAFLMDEPLAALDAALRQSLRADIVALQKQLGTTTIFVTHDQVEAMTMGDMIVVMNQGKVEQIGTPREIYENPQTKFVAGFIGSPPMNFFEGDFVKEDDKSFIKNADGRLEISNDSKAKSMRSLCLGFRPQHLDIVSFDTAGAITGKISGIENLGKEAILIIESIGGDTYRALVGPDHKYRIGDKIGFQPNMKFAKVFEA